MGVSIWEGSKAQALIDAINNSNKIDKMQGVENAGKALVVGNDGLVGFGNTGLSDYAKSALLECFRHVVWTDHDKDYYGELHNSLYNTSNVRYLEVLFSPPSVPILTTTPLDKLKRWLTVKAYTIDGTSYDISSNDYDLEGTLTVGNCSLDVNYKNVSASFEVLVSNARYINISDIESHVGTNISIDNVGNISTDSPLTYFSIVLDSSKTKIKACTSSYSDSCRPTAIYNSQSNGNTILGMDFGNPGGNTLYGTSKMLLSINGGGTAYTKENQSGGDYNPNSGWTDIFINNQNVDVLITLENGRMSIVKYDTGEELVSVETGANRIGFWGSERINVPFFRNIQVIG